MGYHYKNQDKSIDFHGKTLDKEAFDAATEEVNRNNPLNDLSGQCNKSDLTYSSVWQEAYYRHLLEKKKRIDTRNRWDKLKLKVEVRWWPEPKEMRFTDAVAQVEGCLEVMEAAITSHHKVNAQTWDFVVFWSEFFGQVDLDSISRWTRIARKYIDLCKMIYHRPYSDDKMIRLGVKQLQSAAKVINHCDKEIVKYREGVVKGAEQSIQVIEITISILSTVAGGGVVGIAGKAIGKYRLAAELVNKRGVLGKVVKIGKEAATLAVEAGTKTTLESGAKITSLYVSGEKIDWDKVLTNIKDSFVKDIISGGLSKIFLTSVLKPKIDIRFPNANAFLKANGLDPLMKPRPTLEYVSELISSMSVETFYQSFVVRARQKTQGKKLTLKEMLDEIAIEFLKFNFGDALKKIVLKGK